MIYYHFRDLTDYLTYLKSAEYTYINLDVEEVNTKESLDYYVVLTTYNMEKERVYVCVQQIGSHKNFAGHVESAAAHLGIKEESSSKKLVAVQKKADEKSKAQQKEAMLKEFKAAAARIYKEVEFSGSERRWSTEPLVHLPKSVEEVEIIDPTDSGGEGASEETKPADKPEKKSQPQQKTPAGASGEMEAEESVRV